MRREPGEDVLFNTIMMMRMRSSRTVLLTESDLDACFYQKFVSENYCFVGNAFGRPGVLNMLEKLSNFRVAACGGIIDADADYALGRPTPLSNVFRTDKADKETTIIDSPAFVVFCSALNSTIAADRLKELLYEAAFPVGIIRRYAAREGIAIDFKDIPFDHFIHEGPTCNVNQCCNEIKTRNQHLQLSCEKLIDIVQDPPFKGLPKSLVVRGHDLTTILSIQSAFLFARSISKSNLEFELSKAYALEHFRATTTYHELSQWESAITPKYRIF